MGETPEVRVSLFDDSNQDLASLWSTDAGDGPQRFPAHAGVRVSEHFDHRGQSRRVADFTEDQDHVPYHVLTLIAEVGEQLRYRLGGLLTQYRQQAVSGLGVLLFDQPVEERREDGEAN